MPYETVIEQVKCCRNHCWHLFQLLSNCLKLRNAILLKIMPISQSPKIDKLFCMSRKTAP